MQQSFEGSWFRTSESFWNIQTGQTTSIPHLNKSPIYNHWKQSDDLSELWFFFPCQVYWWCTYNFKIFCVRYLLPVQWTPRVRPHLQMLLTVYCPNGWNPGPKYRAGKTWVEAAGEAQCNEGLCQQISRPVAEEVIAAGHPALNSGSYESHVALVLMWSPGQSCFLSSFIPCFTTLLKTLQIFWNPKPVKIDASA